LAGARCGRDRRSAIIGLLKRIVPPYAIASSTIEAVRRPCMRHKLAIAQREWPTLMRERDRLAKHRRNAGIVLSSRGPRISCSRNAGRRASVRAATSRRLLVRDVRRQAGLAYCLRITVGLAEQNARVLEALEAA